MSYTLSVRGASAALALAALASAFDAEVIANHPIHEKDREPALAAAKAFAALLPEDGTKDVTITMSGYATADQSQLTDASVAVHVALVERKTDA